MTMVALIERLRRGRRPQLQLGEICLSAGSWNAWRNYTAPPRLQILKLSERLPKAFLRLCLTNGEVATRYPFL